VHRVEPSNPADALAVVGSVRPDEIYYLAAQSSVGLSFELSAQTWAASAMGLVNVLAAARSAAPAARILNAASGECFGETSASTPATEQSPFRPRSPYAAAKCASHHAVEAARTAFGQFACSAFLFNHESPLRGEGFVTGKIAAAVRRIAAGSNERLLLGSISVVRDWGWAAEYVEALQRMLEQPEPRDFVIATGRSHSLAEFVQSAFAAANLDWHDHVDPGTEPARPGEAAAQHADPTRARHLLGWHARADLEVVAARVVRQELG
jgi:GDPmannose 4,6-dehydratase